MSRPPRRRPKPKPQQQTVPNWLFYTVTLIIVGLWATGIVLSYALPKFQMPESLNAIVGPVIVALYAAKARSENRKDEDERDDD